MRFALNPVELLKRSQLKLFPLTMLAALLSWPAANHEVFWGSRNFFPSLLNLGGFFILGWGAVNLMILVTSYLKKKDLPVFAKDAVLSAFLVLFYFFIIQSYLPVRLPAGADLMRFDSVKWAAGNSVDLDKDGVSSRQKMLEDLTRNVLPGKSRQEIIYLLGEPVKEEEWEFVSTDLVYVLGPDEDSGFTRHKRRLFLWLEDGKFSKIHVQ